MRAVFSAFFALVVLLQLAPIKCGVPQNSTSSPGPISFQPSGYWDGDDGAWSTFAIQIGTPPQAVRLLPSITGNSIWTVWSYGCGQSDGSDCASLRGNLFNISSSSTWQDRGNYSLPLNPEHYLPYSGGAVVGFDNITLDWQAYGGASLTHQVIDVFAMDDFYIGNFGLSPQSINITSENDHFPSIIGSLRQQDLIPSTSWGYLAGASYYSYPISAFGSLTLGGYDSSRLNVASNLTLAGGSDPYRPFLLGIESITSGDNSLLLEPIITALDSIVTQIWLPISACKAFESAFGLVWNDTYELYLLDNAHHSALVAKNASITFTLSTGTGDSTDLLNITLPYAAFDLRANPPLAGNDTFYYFPLKQAANETQYTLGRTLLQEVYVLADYDRGLITLYEGVYPDSSVQSNIVTICPPDSSTCNVSSQSNPQKVSTGAIVGIVIGAILVCLGIGIWIIKKRRRVPAKVTESISNAGLGTSDKSELDNTQMRQARNELEAPFGSPNETLRSEFDSGYTSTRQELSSDELSPLSTRKNLRTGSGHGPLEAGGTELYELPGRLNPPGFEGDRIVPELYGSTSWPTGNQRESNLTVQSDRL